MNTSIQCGDLAKDGITGYEGIVVARTEWLNKCVRITIQAKEMKDGKPVENQTFDEEQVVLIRSRAFTQTKSKQTGGPTPAPSRGQVTKR